MSTLFRFSLAAVSLALASGAGAMTSEQSSLAEDKPAILASLGEQGFQALDDRASAKVRGEATMYVMSTLFDSIVLRGGAFEGFIGNGNMASRDGDLLGRTWRYGYWGGQNWSNGQDSTGNCMCSMSGPVVDSMDKLFWVHDNAYTAAASGLTTQLKADTSLKNGLDGLPSSPKGWDGLPWYVSDSTDKTAPTAVKISVTEYIGGGSGTTPMAARKVSKEMAFSEYARRQAVAAFNVKIAVDVALKVVGAAVGGSYMFGFKSLSVLK